MQMEAQLANELSNFKMQLLESVNEMWSFIEELERLRGNLVAYKTREKLKSLQNDDLIKCLAWLAFMTCPYASAFSILVGPLGIKHCKGCYWCDLELDNKHHKDHLYEMHLLLNLSQREELVNEVRSREELAVLQVEFADMEGQMQQLME
nr:hypothetical protein [Tanacetum cinerariifolium]